MDISSIRTQLRTKPSRSSLLTAGTYISGFLLALAGPIWVHRLRPSDLRYPFRVLDSDLPSIYSLAQALSESWFSGVHHSLGAPKTADWALTFVPEDTFLLMLRVLVKVTGDPIVAVNSFYLLSFGLSALSFLWLSDRLEMRRRVSFPLAVIYAWLPYHFTRMEDGHVFLAAYFMLPLGAWVLLRLYHYVTGSRPNFLPVRHHHRVLFVLLILAIGGSGTYYALFLALLAISTALLMWMKDRSRAMSLRHVGWCIATPLLFLLPAILRNMWAASNGRVTQLTRSPDESLMFGGALHRLLLPWGVWLPDPAKAAVSKTEFEWIATPLLGVTATITLAIVLVRTLSGADTDRNVRGLLFYFFWALIFYATTGLGYIFALLIDPSFRTWNRFAIIVVTLSLAGLGVLISKHRLAVNPVSFALVPLIIVIGWTTQLRPLSTVGIGPEPDTASLQQYIDLKKTADLVQATFEPGCQILQLPIMEYPEGGMVGGVMNGNHLWLPLLTKNLRWSYGGPKGTVDGDYWKEFLGASPVLPIDRARSLDFCGVVVDKRAGLDEQAIAGAASLELVGSTTASYSLYRFPTAS